MAGYKEIKGFQVQTRTEDPSPTEAQLEIFTITLQQDNLKL